ncbi:hypothetical protein C4D60_Mb01t24670 [Musa balbisiana]|uniref:Uncharacterized protein n=1 Tax=Musa balbisiana TaxID=52838 RepID=A0A4S8JPL3_MUSBA|nr:hypothetical protein C4D60_Mb01t24670 [Musa balbisiana]
MSSMLRGLWAGHEGEEQDGCCSSLLGSGGVLPPAQLQLSQKLASGCQASVPHPTVWVYIPGRCNDLCNRKNHVEKTKNNND